MRLHLRLLFGRETYPQHPVCHLLFEEEALHQAARSWASARPRHDEHVEGGMDRLDAPCWSTAATAATAATRSLSDGSAEFSIASVAVY
jgi:hypothetical protein